MSKQSNCPENVFEIPFTTRMPAILGLLGILLFFGGLGIWSTTAPIAGATIAPGKLVASGQNKIIQHLEGGIIHKIVVTEGSRIKSGAPLLMLDQTAVEANLNRLTTRQDVKLANEARLLAERSGSEVIIFPAVLAERRHIPQIRQLLDDQEAEFTARLSRHRNEITILRTKILAFKEEIIGIDQHSEAIAEQLVLITQELKTLNILFKKGLTTQSRVLPLKRAKVALAGERSKNIAKVASVRQGIAQISQEIHRAKSTRQEKVSTSLTKVRAELEDVANLIRSASDILKRIVVRSPISGTVVKINIHTVGGVIQPGQTLIEILPDNTELLIEARIPLADIDSVEIGQTAAIMLSALDRNKTPVVNAKVAYISADRLTDPKTSEPYYLSRLSLSDLDGTGVEAKELYPGMPVDTFIQTKERNFLEYLVRPILDSFTKAFREN